MGVSRQNKRFCSIFFGTVCALFGTLMLYVFIFDPWQLFHQPWFRKPVFISNARFQDAGIINSYDFDSVILGNSMAENFSIQEASEQLGGHFVNLSLAGSLFSERNIILQHLFNKKKIRKVILSLDHLPYVGVGQFNKDVPPEKYAFLYNNNPVDDFRIYFDVNLFQCWDLNTSCPKEIPGMRKKSLEELYSWFPFYIKAFGGTQAWCYWSTRSAPFKAFLRDIIHVSAMINEGHDAPWTEKILSNCKINVRTTFDTYILPFVKEYPDTQFYLFAPPYSRLWYAMQEQYYTGYYQSYLSFVEHIVKATSDYSNVLVFGFDDADFTADIANYKDQSHYHKDIDSKLLQLMAQQDHVLTKENVDQYIRTITSLAHEYDLTKIAHEFQECLNP